MGRAEGPAVADARAFRNIFYSQQFGLPCEGRLHVQQLRRAVAPGGRNIAVERVAGAYHAMPALPEAVSDGIGAGCVEVRRIYARAPQFGAHGLKVSVLFL